MGKVNIKQLNYAPDTGYVIGSGAGGVPVWKVEGGAGSVAWPDITGNQADINLSGFTNDSGFITGNQTITLSGDVTGSGTTGITTVIANNAVTNAKFRQSAGNSIVGRVGGTTGDVADIVSSPGGVLRNNGTLGFGSLNLSYISGLSFSQVVYGNTFGSAAQSSNFTYNGTDLGVTSGSINASAGYKFNGAATSGHYLRGNGTNFVSSLIQASDITTAGGITGSLTTGYLPKAASASSLTNSLLFETGQTVAVGTNTAIDAFSRFYVFGGSNGANLDVRPGGGGYNQAIIDLQSDDFANTFKSSFLVHYGTGALGTTYGTSNVELGMLQFNGNGAVIKTASVPIQIGIGSDEKMRVTSTGVTIGSQTATASAILEASSTSQGFLSPRMTTAQKNAIATPATGLQLVDTDLDRPAYKTASGWESLAFIGENVSEFNNDAGYLTSISGLDHGLLSGLADDDHTQYALLAGRSSGQTLTGGTTTTADLSFKTTSGVGATGADMHFLVGNNGATEAMTIINAGFVGVGTLVPTNQMTIKPTIGNTSALRIEASTGGAYMRAGTASDGEFGAGYEYVNGVATARSTFAAGINFFNGGSYFVGNTGLTSGNTFTPTFRFFISNAGQVAVATTTPDASAQMQINSTTRGFLPPKGTNAQMLAIASPAAGLMFYDTTNNQLNYYNGSTWVAL